MSITFSVLGSLDGESPVVTDRLAVSTASRTMASACDPSFPMVLHPAAATVSYLEFSTVDPLARSRQTFAAPTLEEAC